MKEASRNEFVEKVGVPDRIKSFRKINSSKNVVVVVVITPPLPRDGGTARTAIQVIAVNLFETRLGEDGSSF